MDLPTPVLIIAGGLILILIGVKVLMEQVFL